MAELRPRQKLRPTASLPLQSTGDLYAEKHGIPGEVHNAIPNVAMRIRQSVGQGRTFDRTQSVPSIPANPAGPFEWRSEAEIRRDAEWSIHKDALRQRELRPYSSNEHVDALNLSPRGVRAGGSSPPRNLEGRVLRFGADGEVEMDEGRSRPHRGGVGLLQPGTKRLAADEEEEEAEEEETKTEMDEDEVLEMPDLGESSGSTANDDFPNVFTSPAISHPQLFGKPSLPDPGKRGQGAGAMGPPPLPMGRQMRGLPGRTLGKTVSAPVRLGYQGGGGMDVDGEDGFDVAEWAARAEF